MDLIDFSENIQIYGQLLGFFIGFVYLLNFLNWTLFQSVFLIFGIHPRKILGLPGIFFAPFLHASTDHFLLNAIPFFSMTLMVIVIFDFEIAQLLIEALAFFSGLLIWLFARRGIHVGASALVSAIYGWLMYWTFHHPSLINFSILLILFIYFSSIITGIVPTDPKISWDGHLLGFLSGIITAKYPQWLEPFVEIRNIIQDDLEIIFLYFCG